MLFDNESLTPFMNLMALKGKELQKYNLMKYRIICAILDFYAIGKNIDYYPGKANIREMLIKNGIIRNSKIGRARANAAFAEMVMMGLIVEQGAHILLTEKAIQDYKANTFHQICASLTAAEESRKIGNYTLLISIFAFIVALASLYIAWRSGNAGGLS